MRAREATAGRAGRERPAPSVRIRARARGDGRVCIESPWGTARCDEGETLAFLLYLVQNHLLRIVRSCFAIHGAALSIRGRGCVLAATSGTGKSTLALEHLRRGAGFLSDEVAALDRRDGKIHAFPRALAVRAGAPEVVPVPDAIAATPCRVAGETKLLVPPGEVGTTCPAGMVAADVLVFLAPPPDDAAAPADGPACLELFAPVFPEAFVERLRASGSIVDIERLPGRIHPGLRLSYEQGARVAALVDRVAMETGTVICGHHRGRSLPMDYGRPPRCRALPMREAVERLGGMVLNLRELAAAETPAKVFFELARLLDSTRFYEVVPGRLDGTADLVEALCAGTTDS